MRRAFLLCCLLGCVKVDSPQGDPTYVSPSSAAPAATPTVSTTASAAGALIVPFSLKSVKSPTQCIDTSAGTPHLAACDGQAPQTWGLNNGSLVQNDLCFIPSGTGVGLQACNLAGGVVWVVNEGLLATGGNCLYTAAAGFGLQTCDVTNQNQLWQLQSLDANAKPAGFTVTFYGDATKCLSVVHNQAMPGARLVIKACSGDANQLWQYSAGKLTAKDGSCLAVSTLADASPLTLQDCAVNANNLWYVSSGLIALLGGTGCLDLSYAFVDEGNPVNYWQCAVKPNQLWVLGARGAP